jgi:ornithine cyclodeaminase
VPQVSVLILNHADVEALLAMDECIDVMAGALAALARGQVHMPLRMVVRPPEAAGLLALMPAYVATPRGEPFFGLKAIAVFHDNPAHGKDAHQGGVLLFSGETGELLALMNGSAITAIRTAAVSGLATRLLAREDAGELALVGAGVQARTHLAALHCVRPLRRVRVASRKPEHAGAFAAELGPRYPFPIEPVASAEQAVRGADLVVLATTSSEPVIRREWIAPGAHINAIGAYSPSAREVDSATVAAARVYVDRRESAAAEAGDLLIPLGEGVIGPEHVVAELGEVVTGSRPGRTAPDEITLFKSLGLPIEDLASAEFLYRRARERGAGSWVEF